MHYPVKRHPRRWMHTYKDRINLFLLSYKILSKDRQTTSTHKNVEEVEGCDQRHRRKPTRQQESASDIS